MNLLLADLHKYVGYSGGIEHVLSRMAAAMAEKGYAVSAVFADEKEGVPFFPMPEEVKVYNLCRLPGRKPVRPSPLWKVLREGARLFSEEAARNVNYRMTAVLSAHLAAVLEEVKPDIIISFREPTGRLLLDGLSTEVPVVSMLHNDPDEIFAHSPKEEKKALMKSAAIQVLMPSFSAKAARYLSGYSHFTAIPNAVTQPAEADPGREKEVHRITCVGRLTGSTKRQHLLIEAFQKLAGRFPSWQVDFWGDDYDKAYTAALKGLIAKYGLGRQVRLCGVTGDMGAVWQDTDIFAFPSHHEGFPLALTEAMSAGIPAVGYQSCPAVNELICDGKSGFLTDDGAAPLAEALEKLMASPSLRRDMGRQARKEMEAYTPEAVWNRWDELLKRAADKK